MRWRLNRSSDVGSQSAAHRIRKNATYLYLAQFSSLAVPVLLIPLLSRRLGPAGWGDVAALQAIGVALAMVVEFGFVFSGTRDVAQAGTDRAKLTRIYSSVQAVKLALAASILALAITYCLVGSPAEISRRLIISGVLFGIVQGLSPMWFFQGVQDVRAVALTEVAAKVAAACVTVVAVQGPDDGWIFLASQAALGTVALAVNGLRALRYCTVALPNRAELSGAATRASGAFLFTMLGAGHTVSATPIVHALAGAREAAYFANGDKVASALRSLVVPISRALYPHSVQSAATAHEASRRLTRRVFFVCVGVFLLVAGVGEVAAGWFVPWFFGHAYATGETAFRIILLTMPVVAGRNILASQGLVARGEIRRYNVYCGATLGCFLVFALVLTPPFGAVGMAIASLVAELVLLALVVPELRVRQGSRR